jgi:WYL domain-containing protein
MSIQVICGAIKSRQLLQFYYTGDKVPGTRIVEPYQVGYTKAGNPALSAYYLSGASESGGGPGWRLYTLSDMSQVVALPTQFSGPRPEYKPGTNKILHRIECEF